MILLLFVPLWVLIMFLTIYYRENYYYSHDIPFYYIILLTILVVGICTKTKINLNFFDEKQIKIWKKILFFIPFGFIFSICSIQNFFILFTTAFGEENNYTAEIYNKRLHIDRVKRHHYIDIKYDSIHQSLDYTPLYHKVDINSKVVIKKKESSIGYYIKYKDIRIIND